MRTLPPPNIPAGVSFKTCISKIRNKDLKDRLESIKPQIIQAEQEYINAAQACLLHTVARNDNIGGLVSNNEMVDVYDYRMVKEKSPGRSIYDKIKSIPAHSRCPFCNQRKVSTIDHHLPKTKYSEYTVMPLNLVACCSDCNKLKGDEAPDTPEEMFLHPYFDNIEAERWLYASVIQSTPASLGFVVQPPQHWNNEIAERVIHQFTKLELDSLYRSHSAEEISNIRFRLQNLFNAGGANAIKADLLESFNSSMNSQVNSWQTAMYEALSSSDWFCSIGFSLI